MVEQKRAKFGSKLGMILATAGGAVGLGNVWRFPYMTGQNGGAAFILIYIGCILLLGLPCMISEFIIGRHAASNTARAYTKLSNGTAWKWVGFLGVLTGFLITGYYAVVSGWCLQYGVASAMGHLHGTPDYFKSYFTDFSTNPWKPVLWTVMILLFTHYVIIHGVRNGIERASKIMMPALFILLVAIVIASCLLPGAGKGIEFLLKPDFSKVTGDVFLGALGQSFYSMSIAMGCICTYASYYSRHTKLLNSAVQIGVIDTCVAILAGLMIFPAAFSVGVSPDSGPSLIFITLPNVFEQAFASMPVLGYVISLAFYLLLSVAALTSLISLHEVSTAFFQEELHISRSRAAMIVTGGCSMIGAICSLSLGEWSFLKVAGVDLFDVFDFVTGQIFLPVGGLLTCLFIGWYVPKKLVKDEFTNWGTTRGVFFGTYYFLIRFVCPLAILAIFLHQLGVF
ncbi:sodium-dependent transporter [Prevotella scopos JCM 17725]|jgi:transporter|uniref:Transporter n=1 Tax=Prevotella scopos JCM 17725 TaxID=1236518 RepID=A0AAX2F3J7_9BACT|nr:sodium-dependent transporter [Prevotella scopos]ANR72427.1 Na+-dependent transporter [Prevotella scopos JCM 17725]QUB45365.1 sodium-dependent transporter [Prevotella scopos JCM 17725]SHF79427.1 neurotransmitter:Na+ symporter, NSS family [Prevotella scopos JCM 17725]